MSKILVFLASYCSVVAAPVLTPVFAPLSNHIGVAFYWTQPTNENWGAEWSTNLVIWRRVGNETALTGGLCYTETSTNWSKQLFIRLRKNPL